MQMNWLWGYLVPVGILLLTWGGLSPRKARRVTPLAALALALAIVGYWAVGYAFHLGGAGVVNPDDPALSGLDRIYGRDVGWGLLGMAGFALAGDAVTPTALSLFLAYLPLVAAAVLFIVLALAEARGWLVVLAGAIAGALVVPAAACWTWGGGWLSNLGGTLDLGHGFVDFGGSGLVLWLPAAMAAGVLLLQPCRDIEEPLAPPPAYFPLLANVGALFLGLGWAGWALSGPFHTYGATLDWNRAAIGSLLGMSGAALTSQLYAWLVTGELEPLMTARGVAVGWGAALAGSAFLPPWASLIVGLLAGILFPFSLYLVEAGLRLKDTAATVAIGLTSGLLGLLSLAVFADGTWGQGWNGVAPDAAAGVAGVLVGGGTGQLMAQLVGLLALGLWGLIWGALLGGLSRLSVTLSRRAERSVGTPDAAEPDLELEPEAGPEAEPDAEPDGEPEARSGVEDESMAAEESGLEEEPEEEATSEVAPLPLSADVDPSREA